MKKLALLLVLLLVTSLAACAPASESVSPQDQQAMQTAEAAYTDAGNQMEYMLYSSGEGFIALHAGKAQGIYDSPKAALTALVDVGQTEQNEAETYLAVPVPESPWYICRPDFRGLTYVAFGDSITYGIDGNFRSTDAGYKMAYPYPALVGDALRMSVVRNEAISGASFCPHPKRANMTEKILGFFGAADVISLMLGVNDFSSQLPLGDPASRDNTTIYGCLHLISEYLTTSYPDAFLFYMTPFQYKQPDNGVYRLEDVAEAIKTVAAEYGIPVLDMYNRGKFELELNVAPSDGLHPSQQHHANYTAPIICEFIARHYAEN